jgi:RHS repeat-associated protein
MTSDPNWTYSYDGEGNLKQKHSRSTLESFTYAWSADNKLTEVQHYDAQTGIRDRIVDYTYNAFGEQIEEDVNGTAFAEFGIDGWNSNMASPTGNENINVWARLDQNNHLITRYMWGDRVDQQLARIDLTPATPYWTLQDRLGSIRDVINNSGGVVDDIQYDAFGNMTAETPGGSAYRGWYAYSGREFDTEINLQYNRARWYDSFSGRWISQDPLGFDAGDSNLYRYVNNGPTLATDPSGLFWFGKSCQDPLLYVALPIQNGPDTFSGLEPKPEKKAPVKKEWSQAEVVKLLEKNDIGKQTLKTLNLPNVVVRQSEFIRSEKRVKKGGEWGKWETFEWGGMTEITKKDLRIIHIPKSYSNAEAAFVLVHEAAHARGGDEIVAYTAETEFAINSSNPDVRKLVRPGFVKFVDGKEPEIQHDRIRVFVDVSYKGWYKPDPNVEYKRDEKKQLIIDYGNEVTFIGGWGK